MSEGLPISGDAITISLPDLEKIISDSIRKELHKEFLAVGLRADEPDEVFAAREDFRFVRRMRMGVEGAANKIGMTILVALVGGFITVVVLGVRTMVRG
jgi:hypothetical protein